MSEERWGIWGGTAPGGWCWVAGFEAVRERDESPYWVGSRAKAEAALPSFLETAEKRGNDASYEVVPFDEAREPPAVDSGATASPAMLAALARIDRLGTLNVVPMFKDATVGALFARGWIMHLPVPLSALRQCGVTKAGRAVLDASPA